MLNNRNEFVKGNFSEANNQLTSPQYDVASFLKSFFEHCEGGHINLRFLPSARNQFIPLSGIDSIPKILEANQNENIFFGVATRIKGDGTKAGIIEIPDLWADIDFKDIDREKVEQRLRDFPLKPTFTINSGGGLHPYFKLREPATKEDIPRIENLLRRLTSYFGGDMASTDASRILRVPDSKNFKYQPARDVTIESFHPEREYSLDDFDILPEVEIVDRPLGNPTLPQLSGDPSDAEALLQEALSIAKIGNRDNTGFSLFCKLRDSGLLYDGALPYAILYSKGVSQEDHRYTVSKAIRSLNQAYRHEPRDPRPSVNQTINKINKMEMGGCDFTTYKEGDDMGIRINSHPRRKKQRGKYPW